MNNTILLELSQSPIFKDVDILDLKKLFSKHHTSLKRYKKGKLIQIQDSEFERVIIVFEGKLKAQMDSEDGKTINMEEFCPFQVVALPILFSEKRILPVSLYALEDSAVFFLERETLIESCMNNRMVMENTLLEMSNKVDFLSKKIRFLQLNNIKQKIAYTLLKQAKKAGSNTFKMDQTKEELAKQMGITRPSLSREFANLISEGIISQDKNSVTILKPILLQEYK